MFQNFIKTILTARAIRKERRDLRFLSDDMLRDIGLSRDVAEREANRPVWDAPERWTTRHPRTYHGRGLLDEFL